MVGVSVEEEEELKNKPKIKSNVIIASKQTYLHL